MLTRGDLHIHSTASDGDLSPYEVVVYAKSRGIDTIAIADHNSIDGINEAAITGRQYGVAVIPAVELSAKYRGQGIHLLGYFKDFRFTSRVFREILNFVRIHRINKVRKIMRSPIYSDDPDHLSVLEGIALLRSFGASVVLAHPVRINSRDIQAILSLPFDGIEAKYCNNSYKDTCFFVNVGLSRFSFYTGGSDFHSFKSGYQNHCSIGEPFLNAGEIERFLRNSGVTVLN